MVRMPLEMQANIRALSEWKGMEAPELIRRAVQAMIDCYQETGELPSHFKLVGIEIERPILLVAETQSDYKTGPTKAAGPLRPPDKSKRRAS